MRRILILIVAVSFFMSYLPAADSRSIDGTTPAYIHFIATDMARVGFSTIPVTTAGTPASDIVENTWHIEAIEESNNRRFETPDDVYVYCQVFTLSDIELTLECTPFCSTPGNTNEKWAWDYDITGIEDTQAKGISLTGTIGVDSDSTNIKLINERDTGIDTSSARIYCWNITGEINGLSDPTFKFPDPPNIAVATIKATATVVV